MGLWISRVAGPNLVLWALFGDRHSGALRKELANFSSGHFWAELSDPALGPHLGKHPPPPPLDPLRPALDVDTAKPAALAPCPHIIGTERPRPGPYSRSQAP